MKSVKTLATRIGRLPFHHDFAKGYPTKETVEKLYDERDFQRACQAYLWALPAVAFAQFWNRLDQRSAWFYEAYSAAPSMAPKRPGPSSAYLGAYQDKRGNWLDGGKSYRLRVPANAPMKLFWSVTLYDVDTRSLLVNKQRIADKSSRMDLKKNADGSVDIYCGPKAPKGFESNWIPTVAGRN